MKFPESIKDLKLDIVGLIAIVGEAAMTANILSVTGQRTALLPRLVPAPQAFLKPQRPYRLPVDTNYTVVGVRSSFCRKSLNFFPELLYDFNSEPFELRKISIYHQTRLHVSQENPFLAVWQILLKNILSLVGTLLFVVLSIVAVAVCDDGMAFIGILLLGVTSSLLGLGSLWSIENQWGKSPGATLPRDVVIRNSKNGFLLVRCDEVVSRQLFWNQERCRYLVSDRSFRMLNTAALLLFMAGVLCLANAQFAMQFAIGLSYIVLNFVHSIAAHFPGKWQWDLTEYTVNEEGSISGRDYYDVLVNTIRETGATQWVRHAEMVPNISGWNNWLKQAEIGLENPQWDRDRALCDCFRGRSVWIET